MSRRQVTTYQYTDLSLESFYFVSCSLPGVLSAPIRAMIACRVPKRRRAKRGGDFVRPDVSANMISWRAGFFFGFYILTFFMDPENDRVYAVYAETPHPDWQT